MNHIQPEILDDSFGARGGFNFNSGPASLRGTSGNNFQSFASFLLGLPSEAGRLKLNVAPYTTRSWQYSFYVRGYTEITGTRNHEDVRTAVPRGHPDRFLTGADAMKERQ